MMLLIPRISAIVSVVVETSLTPGNLLLNCLVLVCSSSDDGSLRVNCYRNE